MWKFSVFLATCLCSLAAAEVPVANGTSASPKAPHEDASEKRVSEQVRSVLRHFKQSDPVGFPGTDVPDPLEVPEMQTTFAFQTMTFTNSTVTGLSQFRFESADSDLADMKMTVYVRIRQLVMTGNYTMCGMFSCSEGPYTVTMDGVLMTGLAQLEVGPGGRLRAEDISLDVSFDDIHLDFRNLGYTMSMFQSIINKVGSFLFDSIKPLILSEVNANIRNEVDAQVNAIPLRFPTSMSPLDVMIADARKHVRDMKLDPYHIPDVRKNLGLMSASVTNIYASGLASFYRVGNLTITMEKHVLHFGFHVGTKRLRGQLKWEITGHGGWVLRSGGATFTAEYLQAQVIVNQTLDVRRHPYLEHLDLKLGNIQVKSDGAGKLNHVLEFTVNVLPNLLREQIVNALEKPIIDHVQKILDKVDVEKLIEEKLPELDGPKTVTQKLKSGDSVTESSILLNITLENTTLENTTLENTTLENTTLENTTLENTTLENTTLETTSGV